MNKQLGWNSVATWVFYGLVAFLANRGVAILDKLETSVGDLNVKLAVVVMKTDSYDRKIQAYDLRFDRQDEKIQNIESQLNLFRK